MVEVARRRVHRSAPDGAFLLAQRPPGKVYAGYWEFPGRQGRAGRAAAEALARELHEELGIDVERAYPWITREHVYPHAHGAAAISSAWCRGRDEPHPREDQAIAWQRLGTPMAAPMLPANAPVLASLALPFEYAITDAGGMGIARMLAELERGFENSSSWCRCASRG